RRADDEERPAPRRDHRPDRLHRLTAFFAWSSWSASTTRLGQSYSYTNNWPPEPLVDNRPTADNLVWSVLSLIALLAGIGALLAAVGRWRVLGWHGREQRALSFLSPGDVALTPAQRATAYFLLVMAVLALAQALTGAASQHYRADLTGVFGLDLGRFLPY